MSSSMEKDLYDQPTDSDVKQYEEIRKFTTGQGEDYCRMFVRLYIHPKSF